MKYIEFINNLIKQEVSEYENLVLFGQNISAGSCLGGLTRDLSVSNNSKIINSTNTENSLCGFGFGLMMNGVSSVFFMKQLDFLLLGIDHLVNTFNVIRNTQFKNSEGVDLGSFTIFPITVDNGFQGPQSSLNNFADFCSIARIPGYTITNKIDAEKIISSKLISSGFRILSVSQRLFKEEIISPPELVYTNYDNSVFQYTQGNDVTIVCFNFSFPNGWNLYNDLKKLGMSVSLFNVNSTTPPVRTGGGIDWDKIISDINISKKLIIIDDSKSENVACDSLLQHIQDDLILKKKIVIKRFLEDDPEDSWVHPVSDIMTINSEKVYDELLD